MKKQVLNFALSLGLLFPSLISSQEKRIQPCNTYAAMEEYFIKNPEAKVAYEKNQIKMQKEYEDLLEIKGQSKSAAVQYTIPVVFHILHLGGSENISDAVCINAINQINLDFSAGGSDFSSIFAPFQALYVNSDIKFMLAKKDPSGNCTTGINHIYSTKTDWDQSLTSNYTGITWSPTKYLNIIIVKQVVPQGTVTGGGIIVGYTYKPGTWGTGASQDAIVYRHDFLSNIDDIRSLSHEAGHWLNLAHTFGNTNNPGVSCGSLSGGDGVNDTPDTKGNFSACPASSTNSAIVCTSNQNPYYQNVQNIMDYSNCPKNFTQGQSLKMQAALSSATSGRNNLWSAQNLISTDVNGTSPCKPTADFLSINNSYTVCSGGSLTMKDFSFNGTVSSYQWAANNSAIVISPNNSITSITFSNVGVTNVSLTVGNAQGSTTKVKTVTVLNGMAAINGSYFESFEDAGLPQDWLIINSPIATVTWEQTNTAAFDGAMSYYIDGQQAVANEVDILQMPMINVLNNQTDSLKFSYSYARGSNTNNDVLKIQVSTDCGGLWTNLATLSSSQLAAGSGGINPNPFFPSTTAEWKTYNISEHPFWPNYINSQSLLVRFNFQQGSAGVRNNFFIDAASFGAQDVGINQLTKSVNLSLFPNPSNSESYLKFTLSEPKSVKINVIDVLGKNMLPEINSDLSSGEQIITINKDNKLAKGIYFINLSINGTKMYKKLVLN